MDGRKKASDLVKQINMLDEYRWKKQKKNSVVLQ